MKNSLAVTLLLSAAAACVHLPATARDDARHQSFQALLDSPEAKEKLDGSMKFYLIGSKTPKVLEKKGGDIANRKTNSVGKTPEAACNWAALSALIALQEKAKLVGANAVVDIVSYYNRVEFKSDTDFECHDGSFSTGVVLKGSYAKVAQ
jgi:uncharacterized protein YbjQ (UPF0145 family)